MRLDVAYVNELWRNQLLGLDALHEKMSKVDYATVVLSVGVLSMLIGGRKEGNFILRTFRWELMVV